MKSYLRYGCTVCKRTIDKAIDLQRFVPDRCTITLNCQGRLLPLQYRENAEINPAPKVGLVDWYPRGSEFISASQSQNKELLSAFTGEANQLVLAVKFGFNPSLGSEVALTLAARSAEPKVYRQYVYRFDSDFVSISGVEDGVAKKTLRYDVTGLDPDLVEVFVNGVRYEQGLAPENFQLNDGSLLPAVPPNTIIFNSAVEVSGVVQVDVIVSKVVPLETEIITFTRNSGLPARPVGAWENVSHIERIDGTYYLFTHDLSTSSGLTENSILFPAGALSTSFPGPAVALTDVHLLLARKPFSQVDRYIDLIVPLSSLDGQADYFKYHRSSGELLFDVTKNTVQPLYPPGKVRRFSTEETLKENPGSEDEQLVIDGNVVVGPDI